jgi:ABC-type transport system involved in multi-copper enzyme maturation permease subunit
MIFPKPFDYAEQNWAGLLRFIRDILILFMTMIFSIIIGFFITGISYFEEEFITNIQILQMTLLGILLFGFILGILDSFGIMNGKLTRPALKDLIMKPLEKNGVLKIKG